MGTWASKQVGQWSFTSGSSGRYYEVTIDNIPSTVIGLNHLENLQEPIKSEIHILYSCTYLKCFMNWISRMVLQLEATALSLSIFKRFRPGNVSTLIFTQHFDSKSQWKLQPSLRYEEEVDAQTICKSKAKWSALSAKANLKSKTSKTFRIDLYD